MDNLDDKKILSSGYRVAMRRAERRYRRLRNFTIFMAVAILGGGVALVSLGGFKSVGSFAGKVYRPIETAVSYVARKFNHGDSEKSSANKSSNGQVAVAKKTAADKPSLVIVGIDTKTGKRVAQGILVVRFDLNGRKIDGITIDGNTFVDIPGQGKDEISVAYNGGRESLLRAVAQIVPVKPEGVLETKYGDYTDMVANVQVKSALKQSSLYQVGRARVDRLADFAGKVDKSKVTLIPLPVKSFAVGNDVFFEPDQPQLATLLKLVWGIKQQVVVKPRVIVLNGNGQPGIGAKAAKSLMDAGFDVVETKNADNFDYAESKILVYAGGGQAEKIKAAIGVGAVESQRINASVADFAVILGADYR